MRKGLVIWLYGPSGAGKTTLAKELQKHIPSVLLDGDHMRSTVSKDLGFSIKDRSTHLERMAHIAKHLSESGVNVICAFITPLQTQRNMVRDIAPQAHMVFVDAPSIREDSIFSKDLFSSYDVRVQPRYEQIEESVQKILYYLNNRPQHLYIGRFQPFHEGHKALIETSINDDIPVLIGIKDMFPDKNNPYTAQQVKDMIDEYYDDYNYASVQTFIIPNFTSIRYGRKVGYDIEKITLPEEIEQISATEIRNNEQHDTNTTDTDIMGFMRSLYTDEEE